MRWIVGLVVTLAVLWCGWWFVGSSIHRKAIDGWLTQQSERGWVAERESLKVTGFPNRFDTIITDLELADPYYGWTWQAPEFQILSLSYKPNHIIAVWPGEQVIGTPLENIEVSADTLRGSVEFEPDTALALKTSTIEIANLVMESTLGWTSTLEKGQLSTRQSAPGTAPGFAHDVWFEATDLKLPRSQVRRFDPSGKLPDLLSVARVDMTAAYDAPWDRLAIEGEKPKLIAVSIKDLTVTWGDLDLRARGKFDVDGDGYPQGEVQVTAVNWREMIKLSVASGLLPQSIADTVEGGLQLLARLSGSDDTIDVPLVFSGTRMRLGPVPIGRSPKFH